MRTVLPQRSAHAAPCPRLLQHNRHSYNAHANRRHRKVASSAATADARTEDGRSQYQAPPATPQRASADPYSASVTSANSGNGSGGRYEGDEYQPSEAQLRSAGDVGPSPYSKADDWQQAPPQRAVSSTTRAPTPAPVQAPAPPMQQQRMALQVWHRGCGDCASCVRAAAGKCMIQPLLASGFVCSCAHVGF